MENRQGLDTRLCPEIKLIIIDLFFCTKFFDKKMLLQNATNFNQLILVFYLININKNWCYVQLLNWGVRKGLQFLFGGMQRVLNLNFWVCKGWGGGGIWIWGYASTKRLRIAAPDNLFFGFSSFTKWRILEALDQYGQTILHYAIKFNRNECFKTLVRKFISNVKHFR